MCAAIFDRRDTSPAPLLWNAVNTNLEWIEAHTESVPTDDEMSVLTEYVSNLQELAELITPTEDEIAEVAKHLANLQAIDALDS